MAIEFPPAIGAIVTRCWKRDLRLMDERNSGRYKQRVAPSVRVSALVQAGPSWHAAGKATGISGLRSIPLTFRTREPGSAQPAPVITDKGAILLVERLRRTPSPMGLPTSDWPGNDRAVTQAAMSLRGTAHDTIYVESGLNMPRAARTLDRMRSNPRDWRIASLEAVAVAHGVNIRKAGGSHVVFEHPAVAEAVSVPATRPIKPVYIRRFVAFIEAVGASNE